MNVIADTYPQPPDNTDGDVIYNNMVHVLNLEIMDKLAHNHGLWSMHAAKTFMGYVYACLDNTGSVGAVMWHEAIWVDHRRVCTYRGLNLEAVIQRATEEYGYA